MSKETTFEKLNIKPGDVLTVKGIDLNDPEQINMVQKIAECARCTIFMLYDNATLETVNEHAMAAAGWVRKPKPEAK